MGFDRDELRALPEMCFPLSVATAKLLKEYGNFPNRPLYNLQTNQTRADHWQAQKKSIPGISWQDVRISEAGGRLSAAVFRFARNLIRDEHDAEDITQEVFLAAFNHLASYNAKRALFQTWLFTIRGTDA